MFEKFIGGINGHIVIKDKDTGEILADQSNAIHFENMSLAIGLALSGQAQGFIDSMAFGNGVLS